MLRSRRKRTFSFLPIRTSRVLWKLMNSSWSNFVSKHPYTGTLLPVSVFETSFLVHLSKISPLNIVLGTLCGYRASSLYCFRSCDVFRSFVRRKLQDEMRWSYYPQDSFDDVLKNCRKITHGQRLLQCGDAILVEDLGSELACTCIGSPHFWSLRLFPNSFHLESDSIILNQ